MKISAGYMCTRFVTHTKQVYTRIKVYFFKAFHNTKSKFSFTDLYVVLYVYARTYDLCVRMYVCVYVIWKLEENISRGVLSLSLSVWLCHTFSLVLLQSPFRTTKDNKDARSFCLEYATNTQTLLNFGMKASYDAVLSKHHPASIYIEKKFVAVVHEPFEWLF